MPAINAKLFEKIVTFQVQLKRLDAGTRKKIITVLEKLQKDLISEVSGQEITGLSKASTASLLKNISVILVDYYAQAEDILDQDLKGLAKVQTKQAVKSLQDTVFINTDVNIPTETLIDRVVKDNLITGGPISSWWQRQTDDLKFKLGNAIRQGVLLSETNQQIITRIVGKGAEPGILPIARRNAAALVQTAVAGVANDARQLVYERNDDVIKSLVHFSTMDSHTSIICVGRSGKEWKNNKDKTPIGHTIPFQSPPLHWNCLTGDSHVSSVSDVTGTSKRWFDGEIIVIETSSGNKLSCTPNHPILTRDGWVAAAHINKGGHVISDRFSERGCDIHSNSNDVPTTIHDFVESFLCSRQVLPVPMPVSPPDFHGDGVGSKVAIVYSDSFLSDEFDSPGFKHRSENIFVRRFARTASKLFSSCHFFKSCAFGRFSSNSIMRMARPFFSLLRSGFSHSCKLLLTSVSGFNSSVIKCSTNNFDAKAHIPGNPAYTDPTFEQFYSHIKIETNQPPACVDSVFLETPDNGIKADTNLFGDSLASKSVGMFLDNIISVERKSFHGFVYNLETVKGWYVANGIITHNCRSVIVPKTLTFEEMGIDLPETPVGTRASSLGQIDGNTTFDEYLKMVPQSQQDEMLGKGRAQLWRDGKITLNQLLSQDGRELTLTEIERRYA